jgi:GrpB-like predicted nucleotidyltransferase (UPF0157 family)
MFYIGSQSLLMLGKQMTNNDIKFDLVFPSHPALQSLILGSIGNPTEEKLRSVLNGYNNENCFLLGCFYEKILIGIIGIKQEVDYKFIIKHISVCSEHRLHGIGQKLVAEVMARFRVNKLVAETDAESVSFYRAIGFDCQEFSGEHGQRYICTMSHDNIFLEEYNDQWPIMAKAEIASLKKLLPVEHVLDIQHVGSTSIPGMIAKPIIDIQIVVDSLASTKQHAIEILEANDYVYWHNNPDLERMFFVKGMPPFGKKRTHHVHICEPSCSQWANKIIFRDYLIAHPEKAQEYAALKIKLSEKHAFDRELYTDGKKCFVNEVLRMANDV